MYCQACGNEVNVELKYCNRCGANLSALSVNVPAPVLVPMKLTAPSIMLGLTITGGLGIIINGVAELVRMGLHPVAITWISLFSMAALFGCTGLLIRFWTRMVSLQRESHPPHQEVRSFRGKLPEQLPPRVDMMPSVTENTTRTFSPIYRETSERGPR
jgi:hypothetical protein